MREFIDIILEASKSPWAQDPGAPVPAERVYLLIVHEDDREDLEIENAIRSIISMAERGAEFVQGSTGEITRKGQTMPVSVSVYLTTANNVESHKTSVSNMFKTRYPTVQLQRKLFGINAGKPIRKRYWNFKVRSYAEYNSVEA